VVLTTRYPGLRRIFLSSENLKCAVVDGTGIPALWDKTDDACGQQWHFQRNFAAACLVGDELASMVEDLPPQSLGSIVDLERSGLSPIERLLVSCDCEYVVVLLPDC
jgi:hypothetical protein